MLLTRLELFARRENLRPVLFGRAAGYARMHFYRLRMGERDATRTVILAVTGAARRLTRKRVAASALFERADSLLKSREQRLSAVHRADRVAIDALLDEGATTQFADRLRATGIASETAVVHLLHAGHSLLVTNPEAAANVYDAALSMGEALRNSPRELVQSLQGHAYQGRARALRILGRPDEALFCLSRAGERFVDAAWCADEAGQVDFFRATIFLELEQWEEALATTRAALKHFGRTGNTHGAARAETLEGIIRFEQGDIDASHATWMRLTKVFAALRQRNHLAKVWLNLGNCEIRRNRPADACRWLAQAHAAFRKLNNAADLARTRWNMGTYVITFFPKDARRALRFWTNAYRGFLDLRIWLDAGCVGLDMLETMIDIGTPDAELTFHANSVADTLARVDRVGERIAPALDQLRKIARHDELRDRQRVVRMVRAALTDAKANCNEIAVSAALGEAG
jgi:tetratricopeptide (TPR) repeat protein